MSSTSQKHRNFIAEPMGDKPVTDLAGVGEVLGKRLSSAGFDKVRICCFFLTIATNVYCKLQAYVVLGQFLVLKKNQELFQEWMKDTCQANSKQSADCWQCLKDWCEEFL
jgi:hypothetical protein